MRRAKNGIGRCTPVTNPIRPTTGNSSNGIGICFAGKRSGRDRLVGSKERRPTVACGNSRHGGNETESGKKSCVKNRVSFRIITVTYITVI
jgi:hypothetical protein